MSSEDRDPELEIIRLRRLLNIMAKQATRQSPGEPQVNVVAEIKAITKGDRASEIVDRAVELYGEVALNVFRQIIKLHREGALRELTDGDLYNILERLGLHVPIKTRIRIVRHGEERRIGEED